MNIYFNFNDFMYQVIEKTNDTARQNHNHGLEELFNGSLTLLNAVKALIGKDWNVFLAMTDLLAFDYFYMVAAINAFLSTPAGILFVISLPGRPPKITLKNLYRNKTFLMAVRAIGEKYKSLWENSDNSPYVIDNLLNDAANDLYLKAYHQH